MACFEKPLKFSVVLQFVWSCVEGGCLNFSHLLGNKIRWCWRSLKRPFIWYFPTIWWWPPGLCLEVLAPNASTRDRHLGWSTAAGDRPRCFLNWKLPRVFNRLQLNFSSKDISGSFVNLCEGYCWQYCAAWGSSSWSSTLVIWFNALRFSHRDSD